MMKTKFCAILFWCFIIYNVFFLFNQFFLLLLGDMVRCIPISIVFDGFQGIDENSSEKVRKIILKPRKSGVVKKFFQGGGVNTIKFGEKIPNFLASVSFAVYCDKNGDIEEFLSDTFNEIEYLGYPFSYSFSPLTIYFDDAVDEDLFVDIICKKRHWIW